MIVTIEKCSWKNKWDIEYWYRDMIGVMFEVLWSSDFYHFVKFDRGKKANYINIEDTKKPQ